MVRLKYGVTLLLVIASVLAGCARVTPTPTVTPSITVPVSATPTLLPTTTPSGPYGSIKIAVGTMGDERFFPREAITSSVYSYLNVMYDFMFRTYGADPQPGIVEKWEISQDGLSWIYHIRKGIEFQNGDGLTAKDVKFSLEAYASKETLLAHIRNAVDQVELLDDYTVQVHTKGPQPYLPLLSGFITPNLGLVVPKDYFEKVGKENFERHPIGSGSFKLARHFPGDAMMFEAVENHWRKTPDFKNLSIILMPEETTRIASLRTGGVDGIEMSLDAVPELEGAGFKTKVLDTFLPMYNIYGSYWEEGKKMPVGDIRVRQALSMAINRDEIRNEFFFGKADPPLPPYISTKTADIDTAYWLDYAAKIYRYDINESKRLMNEAGYPNGFSIKLWTYVMTGCPYLPRLAEIIQGYWSKIGVQAEIVPTDWGTFQRLRAMRPPNYPLMGAASTMRYTGSTMAYKDLTTPFHSKAQQFSLVGESMPELDSLIDRAASEIDITKRREIIAKAITMGTDTYTCLMIAQVPGMAGIGNNVDWDLPEPALALTFWVEYAKHAKR